MGTTWKSCKLHENPLSIPKIISERNQKSLQYIAWYVQFTSYIYIPNSNFLRKKKKEFYKQCFSIFLPCKIDSDSAQTLLNSPDHGGLWRFYDYVQNIFIVRKVFIRPLQTFKQLLIQQNWQWNPCFISNIDALCYNNQPKFIIDVWQRRRYNFLIFLQFRFTWTNFSFYISMI